VVAIRTDGGGGRTEERLPRIAIVVAGPCWGSFLEGGHAIFATEAVLLAAKA